jgi:catechol 2,3-dioxygenase-like lactoylglutathione lyase family enzyme
MLISQVELPVSDAVQAARFYSDVLGLPTRTGDGVVEVEVGLSVLLLHPGPVERESAERLRTARVRHRRGRVHPARRSRRAPDRGRQGRPWFPTTTVTPSLGPIAVTVDLPGGGKSLALTANCQVKAA